MMTNYNLSWRDCQPKKPNYLLPIFLILASIPLTVIFGLTVIAKSETAECLKWQQEAEEIPGYWINKWQEEQCFAHDITINARKVIYEQNN